MLNLASLTWYRRWLLCWILGNALDFVTTLILCKRLTIWVELNPVVLWIYGQAGLEGMALIKVLYVTMVAAMLYIPFLRRPLLLGIALAMVWVAAIGNLVVLIRLG